MLKPLTNEGKASCGLDEIVKGKFYAFTAVVNHDKNGPPFVLGVAIANEPGYYPIPSFWAYSDDYSELSRHADDLNREIGVDEKAAARVVCSSMRPVSERRGVVA
jgi:hypothetical protein